MRQGRGGVRVRRRRPGQVRQAAGPAATGAGRDPRRRHRHPRRPDRVHRPDPLQHGELPGRRRNAPERLRRDPRRTRGTARNRHRAADAPLPRNPAPYPAFAIAFEKAHPTFGRAEAFSEVGCANWPIVKEAYDGPWNRRTSQTILVVNPTYDPATRYDFAVRMTRQLGNARLLTLDGFGHVIRYSACVTSWYTRYLLDGDVPPVGTRCKQDVAPFPVV